MLSIASVVRSGGDGVVRARWRRSATAALSAANTASTVAIASTPPSLDLALVGIEGEPPARVGGDQLIRPVTDPGEQIAQQPSRLTDHQR